jgi:hypothetical protein
MPTLRAIQGCSSDQHVRQRTGVNAITTNAGRNMRRTLWPLAALAMIAVIVTGCGNGSAGTGSGGNSTATPREKAVKFAECMRANGVSAFPDPNASGELTIDAVANGSSLDTDTAAFKQAMSACKDLEPPGFTGGKVTDQQRKARLEFAQCVRENGVKDFPDPADDEPLIDTRRIPSSATEAGMSALNAATEKCGDFAAAAGVTEGR